MAFRPVSEPDKAFMELDFMVRDQEDGGSNPLAPTVFFSDQQFTGV